MKILLVEDDQDISALLQLYMRKHGYDVIATDNGEEAWSLLHSQTVNMIVSDIMLKRGINGLELYQRVKENFRLPMILVSCKSLHDLQQEGYTVATDDYVTKPFDPMALLEKMKQKLQRE